MYVCRFLDMTLLHCDFPARDFQVAGTTEHTITPSFKRVARNRVAWDSHVALAYQVAAPKL